MKTDVIIIDQTIKPKCYSNKKSVANLSQTVEFLKIIGEENRLKILCLLREKEKCVCEVWQYLKLPQNLISHHLKILKDFNLIDSRKEGLRVFYSINKKLVKKYLKSLNKFLNS